MKILEIGGVDYSRKILQGSLRITQTDFDGENAQTTLDLVNHRDYLGSLYKIQVTLTRLTGEQMKKLMSDIATPEGFMVTFIDPATNAENTLKFQKTSIQGAYQRVERGTNILFYENISFNLNQTK